MNNKNFNVLKDLDKDALYEKALAKKVAFHMYSTFIEKELAKQELFVSKRVADPEKFLTERDGKLK